MKDSNQSMIVKIPIKKIWQGAVINYDDGNYKGALTMFNLYAKANPLCHTALYNIGCTYVMLNNEPSAETSFASAMKLNPNCMLYQNAIARTSNSLFDIIR